MPRAPFDLTGHVALVTGAGSERGIGRAIATWLAAAGAAVVLGDVDEAGAKSNANALTALGHTAVGLHLDVANEESVAAAVSAATSALGTIDILVSNAGITARTPIWELEPEEFDRMLGINLRGGFLCLRAVVKRMMAKHWGRLIWISSISGKQGGGLFGTTHYVASKAGVIGICQGAAKELGKYGITSNAIAPGVILTGMASRTAGDPQADTELRRFAEENAPVRRAGRPDDIAVAALFLASEQASYITGEIMDVNGGTYMD